MKYSLAITTKNRINFLQNSLPYHSSYTEIDEIVVNDDVSDDFNLINELNIPKVKCFKNETNLGVFRNKIKTANLCSNEWIILLDSDNKLTRKYVDTLNNINLNANTVYCPTFAMPNLNYEFLNNVTVDKHNFLSFLIPKPICDAAFNTCNFVLSKKVAEVLQQEIEEYIKINKYIPTAHDSIIINYLIVKNNFKLFFPVNMHYEHNQHNGSHYLETVQNSKSFNDVLQTLIF